MVMDYPLQSEPGQILIARVKNELCGFGIPRFIEECATHVIARINQTIADFPPNLDVILIGG